MRTKNALLILQYLKLRKPFQNFVSAPLLGTNLRKTNINVIYPKRRPRRHSEPFPFYLSLNLRKCVHILVQILCRGHIFKNGYIELILQHTEASANNNHEQCFFSPLIPETQKILSKLGGLSLGPQRLKINPDSNDIL